MTNDSEEEPRQSYDGLLQLYADAINQRTGVEPGLAVTLLVGGAVITGAWIPSWEYFDGLNEGDDEDDGEFNLLRELKNEHLQRAETARVARKKERDDWNEEEKDAMLPSLYIHLRNAKLMSGGVNWPAVYWRIRLDSVDAFHFGTISAEGQGPPDLG